MIASPLYETLTVRFVLLCSSWFGKNNVACTDEHTTAWFERFCARHARTLRADAPYFKETKNKISNFFSIKVSYL